MQVTIAKDIPPNSTSSSKASAGLMVWPWKKFIPMSEDEVGAHASKFSKILLSCKRSLVEYVSSLNRSIDDDDLDGHHHDEDSDVLLEAIWGYERFAGMHISCSNNVLTQGTAT